MHMVSDYTRCQCLSPNYKTKKSAGHFFRALESDVRFQIRKLPVGIRGIDVRHHTLTPGISVIQRGAEIAVDLIVAADIPDRREAAIAAGGSRTSLEAEAAFLKRAATRIPEISSAGQPQPVKF